MCSNPSGSTCPFAMYEVQFCRLQNSKNQLAYRNCSYILRFKTSIYFRYFEVSADTNNKFNISLKIYKYTPKLVIQANICQRIVSDEDRGTEPFRWILFYLQRVLTASRVYSSKVATRPPSPPPHSTTSHSNLDHLQLQGDLSVLLVVVVHA